ncbi:MULTISPECIES: hypothetical protein [Pseudomonas]|nr:MULTISPECIES: hypothetical protein [Pseudomonas]
MANNSMWRYSQFASDDAVALAEWLDTDFDLIAVRAAFERMSIEQRVHFEAQNTAVIQELIGRTEGQRPAYLKRVAKNSDATTSGVAIVFAILGLVRVRALIEMRERFQSIGPGSGYRVACARIYERQDFYLPSMAGLLDYEWPERVFAQYNGTDSWLNEDDSDPDG